MADHDAARADDDREYAPDGRSGLPGLSEREASLEADRESHPWRRRLAVFLRALSAYQLVKGLAHWGALLAAGGAVGPAASVPTDWFVATVFFAVADPVAAVGLWIGAEWGVVVWLIAASGQLAVAAALAQAGALDLAAAAFALAAMTAYVALSVMARREAD